MCFKGRLSVTHSSLMYVPLLLDVFSTHTYAKRKTRR
jgi:hypothetical protein